MTSRGNSSSDRLDTIKSMYAFQGFVYDIDAIKDFQTMRSVGARNVITFGICNTGKDVSFYDDILSAAETAGIYIIPLIWTLMDNGQTFSGTAVPIMKAVTQAIIAKPTFVIAVALVSQNLIYPHSVRDEPLYDNDAGSPGNLAKYILELKSDLKNAGLDIPVSISDMPYGWQSAGDISSVADEVDFFMINNFPYFAQNAENGGSKSSWDSFVNGIDYFESIAKGRPLLVTQTGWPSNKDLFAPNSKDIDASVSSEQAYWVLLDSHCGDFFKPKNIGWMWRSFNDDMSGWGAYDSNGKQKWKLSAKTTC
ncbi:glycoside hydrolase [Fomitiporia mediterranea MF3/22]|uniref:glycoside hydrolase n=1 Tax=Fomitiporia mediterranea (strain MF3/22) TaxID=694068 RepID=UPI0004407720|nr:glycoside hydrolase [Fomitiporia mediterranea MF3/22]EJD05096.1 glycoside hydrolase [Fomitiporia mediterranea MF3/22]